MRPRPWHQSHKSYGSQAKLTPELVKIIKQQYLVEGLSQRSIAKIYGVSQSVISRAVNDHTYQPFEES